MKTIRANIIAVCTQQVSKLVFICYGSDKRKAKEEEKVVFTPAGRSPI
jgi:uncharacterized membrane protein YsdA (DUF1294 family)